MRTYAPGPIASEPMPLERQVVPPGYFAGVGANVVAGHKGFDAALAGVSRDVAPLAGVSIDPDFNATIVPAAGLVPPADDGRDGEVIGKAGSALDAAEGELTKQYSTLPDPDAGDYDIDAPPVEPPVPDPKDLVVAPPPRPTPSDLVGPDEVHALAVAFVEAHTHAPATTAQLVALADAAGYVQGTFVSRAWIAAFLASPAALHAIGL